MLKELKARLDALERKLPQPPLEVEVEMLFQPADSAKPAVACKLRDGLIDPETERTVPPEELARFGTRDGASTA